MSNRDTRNRYSGRDKHNTYSRYDIYDEYDELKIRRARQKKREELRKRRKRIFYIKAVLKTLPYFLILIAIIVGIVFGVKKLVSVIKNKSEIENEIESEETPDQEMMVDSIEPIEETEAEAETEPDVQQYSAQLTDSTMQYFPENVASTYGLFIDLDSGDILRNVNGYDRMFPASMTKVLTALVACERLTPEMLDDTFTVTIDICDFAYKNDCSSVGFGENEVVTVRDLLYGTILQSGGDAALGLATYISGSQEAFVELMNNKLAELGLSQTTHFTNCVGLFDENHYTTCYDMAMIMEAAIDNELCREVMHLHTYTTSSTAVHPEGITISNWFLRRIEDHVKGGEVYCAKTGFVNESGSCAVSYGISSEGKRYLCVTGNSTSSWKCIKDHVSIYQTVFGGDTSSIDSIPEDEEVSD